MVHAIVAIRLAIQFAGTGSHGRTDHPKIGLTVKGERAVNPRPDIHGSARAWIGGEQVWVAVAGTSAQPNPRATTSTGTEEGGGS